MPGLSPVWASTRGLAAALLVLALSLGAAAPGKAQEREIKVGYMKNPIQDASLDIMEKWAKANNVKLTRIPMAYSVFMEKVTATLTSGADQFSAARLPPSRKSRWHAPQSRRCASTSSLRFGCRLPAR